VETSISTNHAKNKNNNNTFQKQLGTTIAQHSSNSDTNNPQQNVKLSDNNTLSLRPKKFYQTGLSSKHKRPTTKKPC
jgi:hypothetical protein